MIIDLDSETTRRMMLAKPSILGAAVRVYIMGGSALNDTDRASACGSHFLMAKHGETVMGLVKSLEQQTAEG